MRARYISTGVLLYEMLTGTCRFAQVTIDVRHAVIYDQPKPLAAAGPGPRGAPATDPGQGLQKEPRSLSEIDELRDELRKVLHDIASGASLKKPRAAPLSGSSPVGVRCAGCAN